MKKNISLILLLVLILTAFTVLSGCGKNRYDLVLVTDSGNVTDKGFNQSAWDAMTAFAIERNLDCRYFIPSSSKPADLTAQLRAAARDGASVIVAPGAVFETAVYTVQREYPNIKFVLIDGEPHPENSKNTDITPNTASVLYAEEQSGFLAGYAAVVDGMTSLGFMGGIPDGEVCAFGCGFLQGAEYAASETGSDVSVVYHYTGDFEKNETNKRTAEKMYDDGVDVIFACGYDMELSVIEAAASKRSLVICSGKDKRYESSAVLTSAVKGISKPLQLILESVYDKNNFDQSFGGRSTRFDAEDGGAGLASFVINDKNGDAFDRFYKFSKSEYNDILKKLSDKSIAVKSSVNTEDALGYANEDELKSGLGLELITVSVLQ